MYKKINICINIIILESILYTAIFIINNIIADLCICRKTVKSKPAEPSAQYAFCNGHMYNNKRCTLWVWNIENTRRFPGKCFFIYGNRAWYAIRGKNYIIWSTCKRRKKPECFLFLLFWLYKCAGTPVFFNKVLF